MLVVLVMSAWTRAARTRSAESGLVARESSPFERSCRQATETSSVMVERCGDIGLETHPETDQFLRLDAGRGRAQMGPSPDNLTFDQEVSDGWCILVAAGTWHNVTNIGDEPTQLYAIYAPAHHMPGKIRATATEAASDNDDEPADWSVQPASASEPYA
jgi:mannose-6-phosphate isomerase-like protein (cupin superfamily)